MAQINEEQAGRAGRAANAALAAIGGDALVMIVLSSAVGEGVILAIDPDKIDPKRLAAKVRSMIALLPGVMENVLRDLERPDGPVGQA